jgi:putative cell wall-binding protein
VFIAYANGYADTLAVSSIAAMKNAPILYINGSGLLDGSTKYYLDSIKGTLKNIYIIGGTGVISSKA